MVLALAEEQGWRPPGLGICLLVVVGFMALWALRSCGLHQIWGILCEIWTQLELGAVAGDKRGGGRMPRWA